MQRNNLINRILVPLAYVGILMVNYLANALPLGGRDTGVISDSYPNLFAPAGYAFAIWGLIYTLLGIYVVYQFSRTSDKLIEKVNKIFLINALLNMAWIFAWHYDVIWLSVVIMLGLLVTLIRIADFLRDAKLTPRERYLVRLPFSIYFGWITVATIANVTIFLVSLGWNGFGFSESFWTVAVLLVGTIIGVWRAIRDRSIPYALVLVWAYGAILSKHLSASNFNSTYPSVITTVEICLAIFVSTIAYVAWKQRKSTHSSLPVAH